MWIRFYLEASEEAVTFDADAPLPIEVTPAGGLPAVIEHNISYAPLPNLAFLDFP